MQYVLVVNEWRRGAPRSCAGVLVRELCGVCSSQSGVLSGCATVLIGIVWAYSSECVGVLVRVVRAHRNCFHARQKYFAIVKALT
jgi:hypothetical protein